MVLNATVKTLTEYKTARKLKNSAFLQFSTMFLKSTFDIFRQIWICLKEIAYSAENRNVKVLSKTQIFVENCCRCIEQG